VERLIANMVFGVKSTHSKGMVYVSLVIDCKRLPCNKVMTFLGSIKTEVHPVAEGRTSKRASCFRPSLARSR
jgi:hypothetical protein